jgi:hypothetical protein
MGGSLPKLAKVGSAEIDSALSKLGEGRPPLRERPTRQSLEAVRLAEQEKALQEADSAPRLLAKEPSELVMLDSIGGLDDDEVSDLSTKVLHEESHIAAIRALFAQAEEDDALALRAAEEAPAPTDDPFGGLIPVDEEELSDEDLISDDPGFVEGLPIVAPMAARRTFAPSEPPADELIAISSIIPKLLLPPMEIAKLPIDSRAAFILSHVDGIQSMEEILDICAMSEDEAVDLLEKLRAMGVITLA